MRLIFRKVPGGLIPTDEEGEKWLSKIKRDEWVTLDSVRPRNQVLFRKWWALCQFLAHHSERFPTAKHASKWMLIQLGYSVSVPSTARRPSVQIADSISFASMDDDTFSAMYDKAMDLVCEMLPHITEKQVRDTLAEFAGVGALMGTNG